VLRSFIRWLKFKGGVFVEDETFRIGIKARLKHGVLLEALAKRGWSQSEGARFVGVDASQFGRWINLLEVPRKLTEDKIQKLLDLTGLLPDQLWPEIIRSKDFLDAPKTFELIKNINARKMLTALMRREISGPESIFNRQELSRKIEKVLDTLPPRESEVIKLRYLEDKTCEEVAEEMGLSKQGVSRIEARAMRKLRHPQRAKNLFPHLQIIKEEE
jgi:RNA polymerase sigma factor (sigma-70 family)